MIVVSTISKGLRWTISPIPIVVPGRHPAVPYDADLHLGTVRLNQGLHSGQNCSHRCSNFHTVLGGSRCCIGHIVARLGAAFVEVIMLGLRVRNVSVHFAQFKRKQWPQIMVVCCLTWSQRYIIYSSGGSVVVEDLNKIRSSIIDLCEYTQKEKVVA